MRHRAIVVAAFVLAAFATFTAPGHRASADTPTCTDLRPGGQTHVATAFLISPGTLVGTPGRDVLVGSTGADVIKGLGGDDIICSNGGDDIIDAGSGNDFVSADPYPDDPGLSQVHGGSGNDWLEVQGDAWGDAGNDYIEGGGLGTFWGGTGNDELIINAGIAAYGESGNDIINVIGSPLGDGGSGNDTLHGVYEETVLRGGSGNDTLVNDGGPSVASLDGGSGRDKCTPIDAPVRSCETLN